MVCLLVCVTVFGSSTMSQVKAANNGYGKFKKGFAGNKKASYFNGHKSPRMNGGWSSGSDSNGGGNGLKSAGIDWNNVLGFEPSKVLKGGSALEYDHWANEFKFDAVGLGVWDMIAPPSVTMQTISQAINDKSGDIPIAEAMGSLVEDIFARLVPCQPNNSSVRQYKDDLMEDLQLLMQTRIWRYDDKYRHRRIGQREYNKALDDIRAEWENKKFTIETDDLNITNKMVAQMASYDRAKKDYEEKCSKIITLFRSRLDSGPLEGIKEDLIACNFRTAWVSLYLYYNKSNGCVKNTIDMLRVIQTIPWEPQKCKSPVVFIESMKKIMRVYESHTKQGLNDQTKLAYIIKALQRGKSQEFADDIKQAERDQHDLT